MNKEIAITEYRNKNGTSCLWINNIGKNSVVLQQTIYQIHTLLTGNEIFFGFYKTDGINISRSRFEQLELEIPSFFDSKGKYHHSKNKLKSKWCDNTLIMAKVPNNEELYEILENIFHYYLTTVFFCPKLKWDAFVDIFEDYMNFSLDQFVTNGYTDLIFQYSDSGDLSITYNPTFYDSSTLCNILIKGQKTGGQGDGSVVS